MGWLGVVFKEDISKVSYHLALGLTTGFLGSLATFSGWTQKMINLSIEGHWAFAVLGTFIGKHLVEMCCFIMSQVNIVDIFTPTFDRVVFGCLFDHFWD